MKNLAELIKETSAFEEYEQPILLRSGELGFYKFNAGKLCGDEGKYLQYGNDSQKMVQHLTGIYDVNRDYRDLILFLAGTVSQLLPQKRPSALAGGQRKDWVFSGLIAKVLNLPHLSLYKQQQGQADKIEMIHPDGTLEESPVIKNYSSVQVVDLITEGSSIYRWEDNQAKGWVPMQKEKGVFVEQVVAVIDRLQGGKENLQPFGLKLHSHFRAGEEFLKTTKNPARNLAYFKNPKEFNENYLRTEGALPLLPELYPADPGSVKDDRIQRFVKRYKGILEEAGKWEELETALAERILLWV